MRIKPVLLASGLAAGLLGVLGCSLQLDVLGENALFVRGEPFIVSGTSVVLDNEGPCLGWVADNGVTYHLFQGTRVENADFDSATTPGVRSRLELALRDDLELTCQVGTLAEVQRVLEIVE